jgi:hypothetical protein
MRLFAWMLIGMLAASAAGAQVTGPKAKIKPAGATADLALQAASAELPKSITPAQRRHLDEVVRLLRADKAQEALKPWEDAIRAIRPRPQDVNALVQWVLRASYLETTEDLRFYADKVKYFNTIKKSVREYTEQLRKGEAARAVEILPFKPRGEAVKLSAPKLVSRDDTQAEIKRWEEKLNGIGDDAQLANVDLQNILQKQQQTLQMMSNISKMLYDTAQAVIRKLGG